MNVNQYFILFIMMFIDLLNPTYTYKIPWFAVMQYNYRAILCKVGCVIIIYSHIAPEMYSFINITDNRLTECGTNADLGPLISEVNPKGKLTVTVD